MVRRKKRLGFIVVVVLLSLACVLTTLFSNAGVNSIVIVDPIVISAVEKTAKSGEVDISSNAAKTDFVQKGSYVNSKYRKGNDPLETAWEGHGPLWNLQEKVNQTEVLLDKSPEAKEAVDPIDEIYENEQKDPSEYLLSSLAERFQRRKSVVEKACKIMKSHRISPPNSAIFKGEPLKHLMVNKDKEVLYCFLPKVANTNFRRVFLGLQGLVPKANVSAVSGYEIYFIHDKKFKYLTQFDSPSQIELLQKYKKFVFVRDPLERLLSGYRNKFFHPNAGHKAEYHGKVLEFYHKHRNLQRDHNMRQSFRDKEMTFKEFLMYWTDVYDVKEYLNEHFVPATQLCNPCEIDFDYIGKYETIDTEVEYVFENLNIDIKFPGRNDNYSTVATSTLVEEYYKPVPNWLLQKTWNILKFDYVLFGYRLPNWFYEKLRR